MNAHQASELLLKLYPLPSMLSHFLLYLLSQVSSVSPEINSGYFKQCSYVGQNEVALRISGRVRNPGFKTIWTDP
jgi:hypothetical protein